MKRTWLAILVTLLLCFGYSVNSNAQDQIPLSNAKVFDSPLDQLTFPITASITSVTFENGTFPVDFNRRTSPDRWPDVVTPGWGGPLQYTLGMCMQTGDHWACSAVVEFWFERDLHASGGSQTIAGDWFYDDSWGELAHRQPALGETVGIYVVRGDARRRPDIATGAHERSNVVAVKWGTSQVFGSEPTPPVPPVVTPPQPPPANENLQMRVDRLDNEVGVLTVTMDEMRKAFINLSDVYAQLRQTVIGIAAQAQAAESATFRIDAYLTSRPIPADCNANVFGLPVSCTLEFPK